MKDPYIHVKQKIMYEDVLNRPLFSQSLTFFFLKLRGLARLTKMSLQKPFSLPGHCMHRLTFGTVSFFAVSGYLGCQLQVIIIDAVVPKAAWE
jgi:hypothetical protein